MKKAMLFSILILFAATVALVPGDQGPKTSFNKIQQFMNDYYQAYNLYSQDAGTIDRMDEYWAQEFVSTQFLPLPQYPVMNLPAWKAFLVMVHSKNKETLELLEVSIDTQSLAVVARIKISFYDRAAGNLALQTDGVGFYNLKIGSGNDIKITALKLYFADPAGMMALSPAPPPKD